MNDFMVFCDESQPQCRIAVQGLQHYDGLVPGHVSFSLPVIPAVIYVSFAQQIQEYLLRRWGCTPVAWRETCSAEIRGELFPRCTAADRATTPILSFPHRGEGILVNFIPRIPLSYMRATCGTPGF